MDDAEPAAGGDGVLAFDPGDAVVEIDGRQNLRRRARIRIQNWIDDWSETRSGPVCPLKDWPKRVYPRLTTLIRLGVRIAVYCAGESFAVVAQGRCWRLAGELCRNLVVGIAGEGAAEADRVLSSTVDVQINLANQGMIAAMKGSVEAVAAEVQSAVLAVRGAIAAADIDCRSTLRMLGIWGRD